MTISTLYDIGDIVFLKTDPEQFPYMVRAIIYNGIGASYELSSGTIISTHFEYELTREQFEFIKIEE